LRRVCGLMDRFRELEKRLPAHDGRIDHHTKNHEGS